MKHTVRILPVVGALVLALAIPACQGPAGSLESVETAAATSFSTVSTETVVPCNLDAALAGPAAVAGDTELAPESSLTWTWDVLNTGTCPWPQGTRLVLISRAAGERPRALTIRAAAPAESVGIQVTVVIPSGSGPYSSTWQLRTPDGTLFGELMSVNVVVVEPPGFSETRAVVALMSQTQTAWANPWRSLATRGPTPTPTTSPYGIGGEGPVVVAIQYLLRAEGYAVEADGIFGPATEAAVIDFQAAEGLPATGIVDHATFRSIVRDHPLRMGDQGDAVRGLQYLLVHHRLYSIAVDGVFGPDTLDAVVDFQETTVYDFRRGIVEEDTWETLISVPLTN